MQKKSKSLTILALYLNNKRLHHSTNRYIYDVVDWELFAADIEVESVGAVGAVFKQVFFLFGDLFA